MCPSTKQAVGSGRYGLRQAIVGIHVGFVPPAYSLLAVGKLGGHVLHPSPRERPTLLHKGMLRISTTKSLYPNCVPLSVIRMDSFVAPNCTNFSTTKAICFRSQKLALFHIDFFSRLRGCLQLVAA